MSAESVQSPRIRVALAAILLLTVAAYAPALRGPQLFDDRQAIQDNPSIRHLWPLTVPLRPPAGTPVTGRPVVNFSLALNYQLNRVLGVDQQADPGGVAKTVSYHVVNLALHLACGLLLFGLVRRTLRSGRFSGHWNTDADGIAVVFLAIWLLHPIQTDAVDYLIQRTELLASLCLVATLYCSVRAWDAARPLRWYLAGAVACLLGMGSKEIMYCAPLLVVLYDRAFRLTSWRELAAPAQRLRRWFYVALAASLALLVALVAGNPRGTAAGFHAGLPWYEYLHSQGWAVARYLRLVAWPDALTLDYGTHPVAHWRGIPGLLLLVAFFGVTLVAWARVERWGGLAFSGAWFFLILAPTSSVLPIVTEIAAERRLYLPLAAVVVIAIVAVDQLGRRWMSGGLSPNGRRVLAVAGAGAVLLLAALTSRRSALYRDPEAMWRDAIAKVPDNGRAWNNLGVILANLPDPERDAADSAYHVAATLDPTLVSALLNVAMSDYSHGRLAVADSEFRWLLAVEPGNDTAVGGLASVALARRDTAAALPWLEQLTARPANEPLLLGLAQIYLARGQDADAAAVLQRMLRADSARVDVNSSLGGLLLQEGKADDARPYLERALRLQPDSAVNVALLAMDYADLGRRGESVALAASATHRPTSDPRIYFFVGRAMLKANRPDLAASYLKRAFELGFRDAETNDDLGEAAERLGQRREAAGWFKRALMLDPHDSAARRGLERLR
jgi:Flp pilus assembly protein TadD